MLDLVRTVFGKLHKLDVEAEEKKLRAFEEEQADVDMRMTVTSDKSINPSAVNEETVSQAKTDSEQEPAQEPTQEPLAPNPSQPTLPHTECKWNYLYD
jgi:hypothetical protein